MTGQAVIGDADADRPAVGAGQRVPPPPGPAPGAAHGETAGVVNLANALTVGRLVLVPVFAVLLLHGGAHAWQYWAFGAFGLAALTDRLDGEVARRRGLVTDFGKVADPIADKALIGTALVALAALRALPWWLTIVILARELVVTLLRFWVIRHGVIAASRGGKLKTLLQSVAIGLYVLPLSGVWASVRWDLMLAALVVTLLTGCDYVLRAVRLRAAAAAAAPAPAVASSADPPLPAAAREAGGRVSAPAHPDVPPGGAR